MADTISSPDFAKVDIRVGTIVGVENFPEARNPAYRIRINFGEDIGIKKSSARITGRYIKTDLMGRHRS